jgi:hypothetical protein
MWGRTLGAGILAATLCWGVQTQEVRAQDFDFTGWSISGAVALTPSDSGLELPAAAQISRVFAAGESLTAQVRFEAVLSAVPEDVVSVQIGDATMAFARAGERIVVFSAERERLAAEPLLSVELASGADAAVAVTLDALIGDAGAPVRIEIGGEAAEWRGSGTDDAGLEFALSAGSTAPILISEFEFAVARPAEIAVTSGNSEPAQLRSASAAVADNETEGGPAEARAHEKSGAAPRSADSIAAASSAEPGSGGPPDRPGLEVFTPPSVRPGRPPPVPADSNAPLSRTMARESEDYL